NTLDYGLERAWSIAYKKTGNDFALGFDEGAVVIKIGKEEPSVSMDSGKLVWAKNAEVLGTNLGGLVPAELPADGQRINVGVREIGGSEVYATNLVHSPNGCFVAVVGDGEYIIYTALVWRNKAFGPGFGFAWASDSNTYVVKESDSKIKVFKNFKERPNLIPIGYKIVDVKGGNLLGVIGTGFVCFYDWESGALVRRIDVDARNVSLIVHFENERRIDPPRPSYRSIGQSTGELAAIVGEDSFYILAYNADAY
ncbi:unnamed protein product, partial [Tilletia caries]